MNKEDVYIEKIKKIFPTEDEKAIAIASILGAAGLIIKYMNEMADLPPVNIMYCMAMISSNLYALTSDEPVKCKDMTEEIREAWKDYRMPEQTQEKFFRIAKDTITMLYNQIQERENEH